MKTLMFDMDGTIADFYAVKDWLPKIRNEDVSPYVEARPMYDMEVLNPILQVFKEMGFRIVVVSWGCMDARKEFNREIRKAKIDWLNRHNFPYDEIHVCKYGIPKSKYIKDSYTVLIDDNEEVRKAFLKKPKENEVRKVIDANKNIIKELLYELLAA